MSRIGPVALLAFVCLWSIASLAGQGRAPAATIVGVVRDTSGGALPGIAITVAGAAEFKAVTDLQGRFTLSALPAGSHIVRASLTGFCAAEERVELAPGATATVNFDLKVGRLGMIDWVEPVGALRSLVSTVHTIAHVRVVAAEPAGECDAAAPVVARVIESVKPAGVGAGATLTFWQEQWDSEPTPYSVGTELVVFLNERDGTLQRSHGPYAVFPVEGGKIHSSRFLFYRSYIGMPVRQFLRELRAMGEKRE